MRARSLVVGFIVVVCWLSPSLAETTSRDGAAESPAVVATFGEGPWLRDRLPDDAIAYVRLPSIWRGVFGPTGKVSDKMFATDAYVAAVGSLRRDMAADALIGAQAFPGGALLYRTQAPIEVAVIAEGRAASPTSSVLMTTVVDVASAAELAALLNALPAMAATPLAFDEAGYATIAGSGPAVALHFDSTSRRLKVLAGMLATVDALQQMEVLLGASVAPSPRLTLEREIDEQGHGFVLWADIAALRPFALLGIAAEDMATREFLMQTKSLALGWGTVAGHGRMGLRMEMADTPYLPFVPQAPRRFDVRTSGEATFALTLGLPTRSEWTRSIDAAVAASATAKDGGLGKVIDEVKAKTGLSVVDWLAPIGPEMAVFTDAAGDFFATRIADPKAWASVRRAAVDKLGATYLAQAVRGGTIHHLRLPSAAQMVKTLGLEKAESTNSADGVAQLFEQAYARVGSHLFWVEDGEWIVLAGVPQPLMERLRLGARTALQPSLQAAGVADDPFMAIVGQVDNVPSRFYHGYLGALLQLGDLAGTSVDLFKLPTASTLNLPVSTPLSMTADARLGRIALDFNYSQNPMEALSGSSGTAAVFTVAVLAAIAIPAYQDYTIRAEVAESLVGTAALKVAIAESYLSTGELPEDAAALGVDLGDFTTEKYSYAVESGAIAVRFSSGKLADKVLYVAPSQRDGGSVSWACGNAINADDDVLVNFDSSTDVTDIEARYLPAACK